jgi:hypothetical protein
LIQIYAEVITAKFTSFQQGEYDKLSALEGQPDVCHRRRQRLDLLDRQLMVSHGVNLFDINTIPFQGFKPLDNARGLLLANRQISQELKESHYSKNTCLLLVQEDHPMNMPGQPYHNYTSRISQSAKKLYLDVTTTEHHPGERLFQACVDTVKRQLNDIVTSINRSGDRIDSFTVHYTSRFPGEIEDLRVDADGLAAHREGRVIWVMDPRTDKMRSLNHTEMKQLYLHSNTIADALCAIKIPVNKFRIVGDVSGPDLSRLSRKFNTAVPRVTERLDKYGQRLSKKAEEIRDMAGDDPDGFWTDMIRSREQIFSTRAAAIRKVTMSILSSDDPEYHRRMAAARAL